MSMLIVAEKEYLYIWWLYEECLTGTGADVAFNLPIELYMILKVQAKLGVMSKHRELLLVLIKHCPCYWKESFLDTFLSPLRQKYKSAVSKMTSTSKSVSFQETFSEVRLETPQIHINILLNTLSSWCIMLQLWLLIWFQTIVCWLYLAYNQQMWLLCFRAYLLFTWFSHLPRRKIGIWTSTLKSVAAG